MKGETSTWTIIIILISIVAIVGTLYYVSLKYGSIGEGIKYILPFFPSEKTTGTTIPTAPQPYQTMVIDSWGCEMRSFTCPADADYCTYMFSSQASATCPISGRLEKGENYKTKTGCTYSSFSSNNHCKLIANYNTAGSTGGTQQPSVTTTVPASQTPTTTVEQTIAGGEIFYKSSEPVGKCYHVGCNMITDQLAYPMCCPDKYSKCVFEFSSIEKQLTADSPLGSISTSRPTYCTVTGFK